MPSTPNFADLLKNNEVSSDSVIQEVSELCAIARNDLLQIDTEIQRLQEKRAVIQKSIDSYTTILSPIRRLPTRYSPRNLLSMSALNSEPNYERNGGADVAHSGVQSLAIRRVDVPRHLGRITYTTFRGSTKFPLPEFNRESGF